MERTKAATFDGKPCIHGHGTTRYAATRQCVECKRLGCAAAYRARREQFLARIVAWQQANRDSWLAYRRSYHPIARETRRKWVEQNRARLNACEEKRRAQKACGTGVSAEEWQSVVAGSFGLCSYCGERRPLEMDHVHPLSLGGTHDIDNVTTACGSCNRSKGNVPLIVWLAKRAQTSAGVCR